MSNSTYTGKATSPKALTVGSYNTICDSMMPTLGTQAHILLYVNIRGILLPGRQCGTLDVIAVRDGKDGGTDETAVGDHPVAARQKLTDGTGRFAFQAFIPRTWFLARFDEDDVAIKSMRWRVRPDRHSIAEATMTTRYGKAWNGR